MLWLPEQEEKLIKEFANSKNVSVSVLFRSAALEHIENNIDLELYTQAMKEHESNPRDISFDEMRKELGLLPLDMVNGEWRYRIGDYRLIANIDDKEITI